MNGRLLFLLSAWVLGLEAMAEPPATGVAGVRTEPGVTVRLAADHQRLGVLAPSSITFDENGVLYVRESGRMAGDTGEPKEPLAWYQDDLASRTTADHLATMAKWNNRVPLPDAKGYPGYVKRLVDKNGDGIMDEANVYARGFDGAADAPLSGIMAWDKTIYLSSLPKLLALADSDGKGMADRTDIIAQGFGVHISTSGHGMSKFTIGPDGRIYGAIGDCGMDVKTREGREVHMPNEGCVFRFEPDGAGFEVVHRGLHDPTGPAFDELGNLIVLDRNAGIGDKARLVYVVDGGDSGWEIGHQALASHFRDIGLKDKPPVRWLADRIWETANESQPSWIVPPIGHFEETPLALAAYPGTGYLEGGPGRFFASDDHGKPEDSGVWSFGITPDGAGLRMTGSRRELSGLAASDIAFGWDGRLYLADNDPYHCEGGGRILVADAEKPWRATEAPDAARIAREGFEQRSSEELARLLCHADYRVRLRAEFALTRKQDALVRLEAAATGNDRFGRLHGVWGLGVLARRGAAALPQVGGEFQSLPGGSQGKMATKILAALAKNADEESRVQIIRCLGESAVPAGALPIATWLNDPAPRVRYFAAIAAGRMKSVGYLGSIWSLLERNDNRDAYLRHAGVFALERICSSQQLAALMRHPSAAVRLAAVAALAHRRDPVVGVFLHDPDERVALDSLRAIHDLGIDPARQVVAQLSDMESDDRPFARRDLPVQRRILYSAFQIGGVENARRILRVAAAESVPDMTRAEALRLIAQWPRPLPVDASTGHWRPLPARPAEEVKSMLADFMPALSAHEGEVKAILAAWDKAPEKKQDDMARSGTGPGTDASANKEKPKESGPSTPAVPPRADMGLSAGAVLIVIVWLAVCLFALYKLPNRPQ